MHKHAVKAVEAIPDLDVASRSLMAPVVASVMGAEGAQWLVDFGQGPTAARLLARVDPESLQDASRGMVEVLVVFESGDPARPIIVDVMRPALAEVVSITVEAEQQDLLVDGRRIVIEAEDEIVLKCGEGSITLQKDGKVIVKGSHLVSRSTGVNKIKGGSVQIN